DCASNMVLVYCNELAIDRVTAGAEVHMLTKEDNDRMTQVGADKPLGRFFRRYWIPAAKSEEIAEPGGAPVRVGLLGEKLVAFRDPTGKPGLINEFCPHRRASLVYGRNEEGGL